MLKDREAFSSYSVNDVAAAKAFYGDTLGLTVTDDEMGGLMVHLAGTQLYLYPKTDHQPATFTVLNFIVDDIDDAVKTLTDKGITFEHYDGMTGEDGIARGLAAHRGPDIAWFKDPAENIISVLQDK